MISEHMIIIDRNTVIAVIATSIISLFYSYIILIIYILEVIIVIIIRYKYIVIDVKKFNSALTKIAVSVVTIFILTLLCEIWLQLYPHRFTGIGVMDVVG